MFSPRLARLRYDDFPIRLFYYLLEAPERVPTLLIGKPAWTKLLVKWGEDDDSLEASSILEDQKRTALPLMKAQKAAIALRWVLYTTEDRKPLLEESNLPYREKIEDQVSALENYILKCKAQYENNLIQLENTKQQQHTPETNKSFSANDAIATLNLAGFTITDPDKLTIGQYKAMNRTIQRNGKRTT